MVDEWLQCIITEKLNVTLVDALKNLSGPQDLSSVSLLLNWVMHGILTILIY